MRFSWAGGTLNAGDAGVGPNSANVRYVMLQFGDQSCHNSEIWNMKFNNVEYDFPDRVAPQRVAERAGRAAVGGGDRIPLPRARNSGDPCLDPAKSAWVCDVAGQLSWGSMSP